MQDEAALERWRPSLNLLQMTLPGYQRTEPQKTGLLESSC